MSTTCEPAWAIYLWHKLSTVIYKHIYTNSQKQITQVLWSRISFRCRNIITNKENIVHYKRANATRMRRARTMWVAMGAFLHIYSSARQKHHRYIRLMNAVDLKFTALIAVCKCTYIICWYNFTIRCKLSVQSFFSKWILLKIKTQIFKCVKDVLWLNLLWICIHQSQHWIYRFWI